MLPDHRKITFERDIVIEWIQSALGVKMEIVLGNKG